MKRSIAALLVVAGALLFAVLSVPLSSSAADEPGGAMFTAAGVRHRAGRYQCNTLVGRGRSTHHTVAFTLRRLRSRRSKQ